MQTTRPTTPDGYTLLPLGSVHQYGDLVYETDGWREITAVTYFPALFVARPETQIPDLPQGFALNALNSTPRLDGLVLIPVRPGVLEWMPCSQHSRSPVSASRISFSLKAGDKVKLRDGSEATILGVFLGMDEPIVGTVDHQEYITWSANGRYWTKEHEWDEHEWDIV